MRLFCTHVVQVPVGVSISLIRGSVGVGSMKLTSPATGAVNATGGGRGLWCGCGRRGGQASSIMTSVLPGLVRVHGAALTGGAGIVVAVVERLAVFGVPKQFDAVMFLARQAEKADALARQSAAATVGAHVYWAARGRRAGAVMGGVSISNGKSVVTLAVGRVGDPKQVDVEIFLCRQAENADAEAMQSAAFTEGAHV